MIREAFVGNILQVWWVWEERGAEGISLLSWNCSRGGTETKADTLPAWLIKTGDKPKKRGKWKFTVQTQKTKSLKCSKASKTVKRGCAAVLTEILYNYFSCFVPKSGVFLLRKPRRELRQLTDVLSSNSCFWEGKHPHDRLRIQQYRTRELKLWLIYWENLCEISTAHVYKKRLRTRDFKLLHRSMCFLGILWDWWTDVKVQ